MSAIRLRRSLFVMVAMATTAVLGVWISQPSAGAPPDPQSGLTGHMERYRRAFERAFAGASEADRAAAQARYRQAYVGSLTPVRPLAAQGPTKCTNGHAGDWPCKRIDLLSFLPMASLGGGEANDLWGWTDPETHKEYVIFGRTNGTAFVDISDPTNPAYLGNLPSHGGTSIWRAVKVYRNVAYIVADALPHGMQVFDLTRLRDVTNPPVTFTEDFHYGQMDNTHTLAVNEETGYLYAVGTNTCSGGLHMIDVHSNPLKPRFAGCYSADGYVHEAQCVVYQGPDVTYQGHEVCFAHDEDTVTIIDVTDKSHPVQISRTPYAGSGYTHQGWLTESQRVLVVNDELDEEFFGHNTRTRFFDVRDLDSVPAPTFYSHATKAIDHNLYVRGPFIFETNYRAGLRILTGPPMHEIAFFDVWPSDDAASFNGTWNNYPFFGSGIVAVSGIEQGLFLFRPRISSPLATSDFVSLG
jgi:choice-of-anchor B domain-containing protein